MVPYGMNSTDHEAIPFGGFVKELPNYSVATLVAEPV